jgi:hypothetical protein
VALLGINRFEHQSRNLEDFRTDEAEYLRLRQAAKRGRLRSNEKAPRWSDSPVWQCLENASILNEELLSYEREHMAPQYPDDRDLSRLEKNDPETGEERTELERRDGARPHDAHWVELRAHLQSKGCPDDLLPEHYSLRALGDLAGLLLAWPGKPGERATEAQLLQYVDRHMVTEDLRETVKSYPNLFHWLTSLAARLLRVT